MKLAIASCAGAMTLVTALGTSAAAGTAPSAGHRAAGTTASTAHCGMHWTATAKHAGKMVSSPVSRVTAGEHPCFDRLVIGLGKGNKPGYRVQYVKKITQDASGKTIHVRGRGKLQISVLAPATNSFPANSHHLADVTDFRAFRQVVGAGSFEGITSIGLGVRAKRLPFRVFRLSGPGHGWRLVIDVAHRK
jgi:hypothetical protein